jgi:Spy/CpxP family protein refolding chaperone
MKRKLPIAFLIVATLVLSSVTIAHAEWGKGKHGKVDKQKMKDRVELIKMWKLTEALDLDQETAMKLFPLLNDFDGKKLALRKKRGATMKQMNEELKKEATDSAALRRMIEEFKKNERDLTELRMERIDALSKVLSDEQIARMIALAPKIESRIRELVGEARGRSKERGRWSGEGRRWSEEGRRWSRDPKNCPHGPDCKCKFK